MDLAKEIAVVNKRLICANPLGNLPRILRVEKV